VRSAGVKIDGEEKARIGQGLLILIGIETADNENDIDWLCKKIVQLRIFNDEKGIMNLSVKDINGEILVVSQFTLFASTAKGNRPAYIRAAKPEISIPLYKAFCLKMTEISGKSIQTGIFGADMDVALHNDGPVTIWIDSKQKNY